MKKSGLSLVLLLVVIAVGLSGILYAKEISFEEMSQSGEPSTFSSLDKKRDLARKNERMKRRMKRGSLDHDEITEEGLKRDLKRKHEIKQRRCPGSQHAEEMQETGAIEKERAKLRGEKEDDKTHRGDDEERKREGRETALGEEGVSYEDNPEGELLLSPFEAYVRGETSDTVSLDIDQFGYDFFECPPTTFAPVDNFPVGPDYLLGPGDELAITLWGKIDLEYFPTIDSEGKIVLPEIGVLHLSGLTFSEAKSVMEKELSRYYRPSEIKMNVSMGRLRSMQVYVVGQALWPGGYTLSSFSTLINALFSGGGPNKSGTLRDIQVKRNGETVVHFDLYDFLLKGDKTKDIRLMSEDVIFIPPVGPLVGIAGNVKNPAIYELKGETRLLDLIKMGGGLSPVAFSGRVQVQRIQGRQFITLLESDLIDVENDPKKDFVLNEGDLVTIFPVREEKDIIFIDGAVGAPGEYGLKVGSTRISDLIAMAGGLKYFAFHLGELNRLKVTQEGPRTERITVDITKAIAGDPGHNRLLEKNDFILIKDVPQWQLYRRIELTGEVRFPGVYIVEKGELLSSVIERAGGFTDKAYLKGAIFTRESVREVQTKHLTETIDRLEQQFLSGSATSIETALSPEAAAQQKGALEQRRALLAKMRAAIPIGRMTIRLSDLESFKRSPYDIAVEDQDTLFVPEKPSSVQVMGSVYNQGSFLYQSGMTVADALEKSGGMGQHAEASEMYILKVDGTAVSRTQIGSGFFGKKFVNLELETGDTVVVPEKLERIAWLREIKDITQILANLALTAGVFIRIF